MFNINEIINALLSNEMIRTLLTYYIVGVVVWFTYLIFINKITLRSLDEGGNNYKQIVSDGRIGIVYLLIIIVFVLMLLGMALNYVGFLPYGPDTAGYTYDVKKISTSGYWRGPEGYYGPYHTSVVLFTILTQIIGSLQVAYFALLAGFLLGLLFISGIGVHKISKGKHIWLSILIVTLLFIATSNLGGFDLLQQYLSLVYATIGIMILIEPSHKPMEHATLFILFTIISIITHLTSVILSLILLVAFYTFMRENKFKVGFVLFNVIAITYVTHFIKSDNIILSLYILFKSLTYGTLGEFTVRAFTEIPMARISLLSRTLLISIASAHILFSVSQVIKDRFSKITKASLVTVFDLNINKFVNASSIVALMIMFVAVASRLTAVELIRYLAYPSYILLLISSSIALNCLLNKTKVNMFGLTLFLLVLCPYVYSAMNSDGRTPWSGEIRLAPITYTDRLEMLILAKYGSDGYHVYAWHDVYIPLEEVENPPFLISGGCYYPIHDILVKVAKDEIVNVLVNSYLIIHKEAINTTASENYNVVFDGYDHIISVPIR